MRRWRGGSYYPRTPSPRQLTQDHRDNNNAPLDKTQATEPFEDWEEFITEGGYQSPAYREAKEQAVEVLWRAIERYVPDVRQRVKVALPATPLTHRRFNRRDEGTYGPFLPATSGQLMGHARQTKRSKGIFSTLRTRPFGT